MSIDKISFPEDKNNPDDEGESWKEVKKIIQALRVGKFSEEEQIKIEQEIAKNFSSNDVRKAVEEISKKAIIELLPVWKEEFKEAASSYPHIKQFFKYLESVNEFIDYIDPNILNREGRNLYDAVYLRTDLLKRAIPKD